MKFTSYKIEDIGLDFGDAPFGTALKTKDYTDSGIPVIQGGNIRDQKFIWNRKIYVSQEKFESLKRSHCHEGDLVFPKIGNRTVGSCAIVPKVEGYKTFLLSTNLMKLNVDSNKCHLRYIYYYFCQKKVREHIVSIAGGGAQPIFNFTTLKGYEVKLPSLPIQSKVANILSNYDDLIGNNTRRIQILEEMAQRIYREWFVKFRFPGHENVKMVESELEVIPEGWVVKALGELIAIRKGKNITKKTIVEGSVPVVAGGLKPAYHHNVPNTKQPVITISASGANAGFICLYQVDVWASDCSVIDLDTTPHVYYHYLHLKYRQKEVTGLQRGSAQPHVYPKDLMRLIAIEPPGKLLEIFGEEVSSIFQLIQNLVQKNVNLLQTRDFLLPKLISGKIDVSELDIDIGEDAA